MKKVWILLVLAAVLAGAVLNGCAAPVHDLMKNVTPNPVAAHEPVEDSGAAVTDFAVRLLQNSILHNSMEEGKNTLISPLSVLTALSMTANGAKGETLTQMETVLGMPVDQLNNWIHLYMAGLPADEKYKLSMANSVWFTEKESFTVNDEFLQTNADYYGAGIYRVPFDDSTCKAINNWVEDHTDGMIKDILDRISEDAVMYLVNALAFDAEWQKIYKEAQIRGGVFTTEDGNEREVELMYAGEYGYLEDELASGFLKYYADRKYAFAALLPAEGVTVAEYAASLTGAHLHELLTGAQPVSVDTAIPKFETEYDMEMSKILIAMGMPDAFDSSVADLSGLGTSTDGPLAINRVLHKTYIHVDGKGTKAGAATVVEVETESAMEAPEERKQVFLDRPFVYMLVDCETMLPFFIGTMMDPQG